MSFSDWKWISSKDGIPVEGRYIYIFDGSEVDILYNVNSRFSSDFLWSYVFIPDVPKYVKLEPCKKLKGCSNDYILALEERIEKLEKLL